MLEFLDVLSSLFRPICLSAFFSLYSIYVTYLFSLLNHISSLSLSLSLSGNECYIFCNQLREEKRREGKKKRMLVKEKSGENSLVRSSITVSCLLTITIRERLMNNYSI